MHRPRPTNEFCVDCLFLDNIGLIVESFAKSGPTTQAAAHSIYCPDTVAHCITLLCQSGVAITPIIKGSKLMLSSNEPESMSLLRHCTVSIEDSLEKANGRLVGQMQNPAHCLHSVLPNNNKSHRLFLRKRGHIFTLP